MDTQGRCVLLNRQDPMWFMHTAEAALQAVRLIRGELEPPLHLREYIFETDNTRQIDFRREHMLAEADVIITEVCTLRSIDVDGWEANAHRMAHARRNGDEVARRAAYHTRSADEVSISIEGIFKRTAKPVLIVNHISPTGIGAVDDTRGQLTAVLSAVAGRSPSYGFFDTGEVLRMHSSEDALEDKDHYRKDFEPVVGDALLAAAQKLLEMHQ